MVEMTLEQKRALAIANARLRARGGSPKPNADQGNSWLDTAADYGGAAAAGLVRGATGLIGLPGTLGDLFNDGMSWATGSEKLPRSQFSANSIQNFASDLSGGATDYRGDSRGAKVVGGAAEFIPGAVAFGGLSPSNILRYGALPGAAQEVAGQLTEGSQLEPYARVASALIAPAIPALASKAISPFSGTIAPDRQAAIDSLTSRGIQPTAGQATGSQRLLAAESELAGELGVKASEQLTEAALKSAGINATKATPEALEAGYKALGSQFDDLASRSSAPFTSKIQDDLLNVVSDYIEDAPAVAPVVENTINRIAEFARQNNGVLSGEAYQKMRSFIGGKANSIQDFGTKSALRDIQSVLDDAVEAGLNAADKAAWQQVRQQYRNYLTVERAATSAGANAASGIISPAQLRSAVVNTQGRRSYAHATGELQDLARSAEQIMTPLPNSGTALRLGARTLGGVGAGAGGGAGALMGGAPGAMMGAAAGVAAPYVAGAALSSKPVQQYLLNQVAPNMSVIDKRTLAVIEGLLANQGNK